MVTAEQMLGTLNADDKGLLCQYHYRLFKYLESVQRTTDAELRAFLSTQNDISRDFGSDIYIHSSTLTMMGKFVALK